MINEIRVGFPDFKKINFDDGKSLYTAGIEACLAVAGIEAHKGALMHLTQVCDVDCFLNQFFQQISSQGQIYLVGGMQGKAELFVDSIKRKLIHHGYRHFSEHTLTPHVMAVRLFKSGCEIAYQRMIRFPTGEFQSITYGGAFL